MSIPSWEPDPTGRHQYRWWDGEQWTDQVADDGVQTVDPVSANEAGLPLETPPSVPAPSRAVRNESHDGSPPDPMTMLASRGKRFGAFLLEIPLAVVTLGIGYLIWALIVYSQGLTPAKQLLKMRVVNLDERRAAGWLSMFLREWILKGAIPIGLNIISVGIVGTLWVLSAESWCSSMTGIRRSETERSRRSLLTILTTCTSLIPILEIAFGNNECDPRTD